MKVAIIINGISRKKKFFYTRILPPIQQQVEAVVFETQFPQHAIELAALACAENFDYVIAAGGDGTLNQVLNGVVKHSTDLPLPTIGIIPLGTGNDFAKLCGINADGRQIAALLSKNQPKPTDIGKIECCEEHGEPLTNYFINVCSLGMGPEVVKRLMKSDRSLGPLLTYLKAITQTFFSHKPQQISARGTGWEWSGKMRVFAIANGISFGNEMYIAPDALPDDGVFACFIAGELPLFKFLLYLQKIKAKQKIKDPHIHYNITHSAEVTSPEPCAIEAEGEWMGWLPMKIEILPKRIQFLR
jgi:YegS/Rv2252/BmrU family lipid kinase